MKNIQKTAALKAAANRCIPRPFPSPSPSRSSAASTAGRSLRSAPSYRMPRRWNQESGTFSCRGQKQSYKDTGSSRLHDLDPRRRLVVVLDLHRVHVDIITGIPLRIDKPQIHIRKIDRLRQAYAAHPQNRRRKGCNKNSPYHARYRLFSAWSLRNR